MRSLSWRTRLVPATRRRAVVFAVLCLLLAIVGVLTYKHMRGTAPGSSGPPGPRTVCFPEGFRLWGYLFLRDWDSTEPTDWEFWCEARGTVVVPAGKELALELYRAPPRNLFWDRWLAKLGFKISSEPKADFSFLETLGPDDLEDLSFTNLHSWDIGERRFFNGRPSVEQTSAAAKVFVLSPDGKQLAIRPSKNSAREQIGGFAFSPDGKQLAIRPSKNSARGQITDRDLANLKHLTGLRELDLSGTHISDAGLVHLKRLTGLRLLNLHGTKVTENGVRNLAADLPNCKIRR